MAEQAIKKQAIVPAKPILKWAGGKTQMLNDLLPKVPSSYGRYIEPFFGGGALFFALQPENAIISDSNPELINMYRQVADFPDEVIQCLKQYENTKEMFYNVRSQTWEALPKAEAAARTIFLTVIDLFAGSGIVGYMFKAQGKSVISNDYMAMSATFAKAMIENNSVILPIEEAKELLIERKESDHFVAETFQGLYYKDEENDLIDILRTNIATIQDQYKRAIAMAALIRACTKKRPRGIFTYTGERYNDGRKDLQKSLAQQFLEAVDAINKAVFDNGKQNRAKRGDAMELRVEQADLVYIDPPYYSPLSDNEYVRRYHFVEGLARDWQGIEIQQHTLTKKFKSYPTPFSTRNGAADAFDRLFKKFAGSILIVSYSSNSLPAQDEMVAIMSKYKKHVEVIPVNYKYSFGNQSKARTHRNSVQEYLFVGY